MTAIISDPRGWHGILLLLLFPVSKCQTWPTPQGACITSHHKDSTAEANFPGVLDEPVSLNHLLVSVATGILYLCCRHFMHIPVVAALSFPGLSQVQCASISCCFCSLAWVGNRCLRMAHTQRWGQNRLSPRCGATKEEEQKSLYSCTSCGLNPHSQPGKPCICGIFEWKMSAPATEPSLSLAAVDFGDKHTSELGQVRVFASLTVPTENYLEVLGGPPGEAGVHCGGNDTET